MTTEETNKIVKSFNQTLIDVFINYALTYVRYTFPSRCLSIPKKTELALTSALNYAYLNNDQKTARLLKTVMLELNLFIDDDEAYRENNKVLGRKESGSWPKGIKR